MPHATHRHRRAGQLQYARLTIIRHEMDQEKLNAQLNSELGFPNFALYPLRVRVWTKQMGRPHADLPLFLLPDQLTLSRPSLPGMPPASHELHTGHLGALLMLLREAVKAKVYSSVGGDTTAVSLICSDWNVPLSEAVRCSLSDSLARPWSTVECKNLLVFLCEVILLPGWAEPEHSLHVIQHATLGECWPALFEKALQNDPSVVKPFHGPLKAKMEQNGLIDAIPTVSAASLFIAVYELARDHLPGFSLQQPLVMSDGNTS